jgi:hypothetical protein
MSPKSPFPELTNLLPEERIRGLRREYYVRLATVAVSILAAVVVASAALLAPSYLYVRQEIASREAQMKELDARLGNSEGKEVSKRLTTLSANANYLARLASTSSATAALRGVLAVPRPGIVLGALSYVPASHGTDGKMLLTGVASTRETLRAYNQSLAALPYVANAELPISAYAKESNIPFSITLTGTLMP